MRFYSALVFVIAAAGQAGIFDHQEYTIDLTEPNSITEHGVTWEPQEKVHQTERGLVFQPPNSNATVDLCLLTKAYPLGLSWRPASSATVSVDLSPIGEAIVHEGKSYYPSPYSVYVRYSPDLKRWSSWQVLQDQRQTGEKIAQTGVYSYRLTLKVPGLERRAYGDYLGQYMRMDVAWPSDEEAMVKWILSKEPDFFDAQIPFIGYVQLLCESVFQADQPLRTMKIGISWGVGGMHTPPKEESVFEERGFLPWRFQSPVSAEP